MTQDLRFIVLTIVILSVMVMVEYYQPDIRDMQSRVVMMETKR